jgi:C4-dicarboxylate transporter DctM subunit
MTIASDASPATTNPAEPSRRDLLARGIAVLDIALECVTGTLLAATVVIALIQVFFRYVLNDSLAWPEEVARWAFVWCVFLGSAMVARRKTHIIIDLLPRMLGEAALRYHAAFARVIIVTVAAMLLMFGIDLVHRSSYVSPAMQWPFTYLYLAVPVGAALTFLFMLAEPVPGWRSRWSGVAATLLGIALFYVVRDLGDVALFTSIGVAWTLLIFAVGTMLLGVPIFYAILFGTFIAFLPQGEMFLLTVPQNMTSALDSFLLLAIPFFITAAGIMNVGGITDRLIALAAAFVGHFRGGLGHVNVLTNTLMGGISGSSMADTAAIAKTMVPAMEKRGFPRPFGCALTGSAAILANMIPPSMGLIIYGALASVSVGALFIATIVPGLLMAAVLSVVVHLVTLRMKAGMGGERANAAVRWRATLTAVPALVLPIVIVGGIRAGIFTATEAGAIAALYALCCGLFIYRTANFSSIVRAMRESLSETIAVMVIISASAPFAWILVADQVPQKLAEHMGVLTSNWMLLLFVINLFLLVVGLFMEMIASMVILVPILVPMLKAAHIDLVQFGIIMVGNLCIGALTPPLGMLVYTAARVTDTPTSDVFRAMTPFLIGLIAWLFLISFVPSISLFAVWMLGR